MADERVTYFKETYYDSPAGKIAIVTMDNGEDYTKPNTFGEGGMASLNECLDRIAQVTDVKALLYTGKVFIFAVGADLNQVPDIPNREEAKKVGVMGHTAFKRIKDLPYPTVAAVNGAVMGGGLEIALMAKYRTFSTGITALAFPECFIGLVPGWGGCTLLPRLLGPEKALQVIINNALNNNVMLNGKKAFGLGMADQLFEAGDFLDKSLAFTVGLLDGSVKVDREPVDMSNTDALCDAAKAFVDMKVHGAAPAPYRAIEIIRAQKDCTIEEGFAMEDEALADMIMSPQCRASVYAFDLVQRRAKRPVGVPEGFPQPVKKVGIVGAGLMGSQLGMLFLRRMKIPIVIKDIKQEFVDKGVNYIRGELDRQVSKGRMDQGQSDYLFSLVKPTLDYADMADCDFIIEAVLEEIPLKKKVFGELEGYISETAILATNTSSLSITDMASELKNPERVVGFHFFNPVAVLPLLEIIKAEKTGDQALVTAFDLARKIGKRAIRVKDAPAFLVNRLLVRMMVECTNLVDEGNSFKDVDDAMLALGIPMAPFVLMSLVGPAIALHTSETLTSAFPDRYKVSPNMVKLVEAKKVSVYGSDGNNDPEVAAFWQQGSEKLDAQPMRDRVLTALCDESWRILDDGVVAEAADIDTGLILGAGYPFFMGGVTMYLDSAGYAEKVKGKRFH